MIDELTKHQILLQRYYKGIFNDIKPLLKSMRKDIIKRLSTANENEYNRLSVLISEVDAIITSTTAKMSKETLNQIVDFYDYESKFTVDLLDKSTTTATAIIGTGLSAEQILSSVTTAQMDLMGDKFTIDQLIANLALGSKRDITTIIRSGIVDGSTTSQIVSKVDDMLSKRTPKQAESVILTVANHVGSIARQNVWKNNQELIMGEEYVATLDSRTTITCASLDGKIFNVGEGAIPPLHYRCRSFRVPKLKPQYDIDIDSKRQSVFGQVSANTNYGEWLKKQSNEFQNEVLGVERAKLFRSGDFKLTDFVDDSGKVYTLKELEALNFS